MLFFSGRGVAGSNFTSDIWETARNETMSTFAIISSFLFFKQEEVTGSVPPAESAGHLCCWDPSRPGWRPRGWRSCSRRGSPWNPWCCPAAPLWCSWICTAGCCSVGVQRRHLRDDRKHEHIFTARSSRDGETWSFKDIPRPFYRSSKNLLNNQASKCNKSPGRTGF